MSHSYVVSHLSVFTITFIYYFNLFYLYTFYKVTLIKILGQKVVPSFPIEAYNKYYQATFCLFITGKFPVNIEVAVEIQVSNSN